MKKFSISFVALMLIATMMIPLLTACDGNSETSTDESVDSSFEVSYSGERIPVENPELATVISKGKAYTVNYPANEKYPDDHAAELTDGVLAPAKGLEYTNSKYAGYNTRNELRVTIDLGERHDKIYKVVMGYLCSTEAGIAPPQSVDVYVSSDGRKYEPVGTMKLPEFEADVRQEGVFECDFYLKARYIRLIAKKQNTWMFVDEISVIANEEETVSEDVKYNEMVKNAYDTLGTISYKPEGEAVSGDYLKLVSEGCDYTSTGKTLPGYLDKDKYLTNGENLKVYGKGSWTGYKVEGAPVEIVVDLGKVVSKLCEFRITCYSNNLGQRYLPSAVTYSVSNDGKTYTDIGRVFGVMSGQSIYDFPLMFDNTLSARYVKFTLHDTPSKGFVIEEAAVYACTANQDKASWYKQPISFETETKPFAKVSKDKVNLIKGNIQQIFIPEHVTGVLSDKLSEPNTPVLTDGKKATANDIHNGQFYKFQCSAAPIEFYYDMGDVAAVSEFNAQFTHHMPWGVAAPYKVFVYLSEDSENWYSAGYAEVNPEKDECIVDASLKLSKPVKARYVCFYMIACGWIGVSELEVMGTTSTDGAKALAESGLPTKEESALGYYKPNEDVLNGAKDLCLLYHGKNITPYTEDKILPYLAYIDTEGNIKDTMFDSFLFLLSGGFPSGKGGSQGYTQEDIEWVVNDLFVEGENILALEKVAGEVKQALGLDEDFKYGLTIAVYQAYPGDPDLNKRIKGIKDQIALFESKFNQYDFKNIELVAYYWFDEGVYDENNEVKLVQAIADHVHGKGLDFFWIPWFCASGIDSWQDHKFDVACMQPGYVFRDEVLDSRMESAAEIARYFGMGIEIEIGSQALSSPKLYQRYIEYLTAGAKYDYIKDCVHMYYQEIMIYGNAARSGDEKMRMLYDYTYMFIKGTLPATPEALETVKVEGSANTLISGTIMEEVLSSYEFDLVSAPEGGTVALGNDGTFVFFPNKDFKGKTSFTYTYNVGLGDSELCTVEIEVK